MSGFSFPPPPPPPPKPSQPQQYSYENRGRGRGRGGHRGGPNQRGGHLPGIRSNYGSGVSQYITPGHAPQNHPNSATQPNVTLNQTQHGFPTSVLPPGAYVNPHFAGQQNSNGPANANRATNSATRQGAQDRNEATHPPRTAAGQKRKLDALREPTREKKPAPPTPPAIPGFGASTLPAKPMVSSNGRGATDHKQAITNTARRSLGLVPKAEDQQYPSSDSENDEQDVDEEAAYAELGDKLTFEHNGVLLSLNSLADLNAWKKERQKNYPTAQRKAAKYVERQRIGEERKRLLAGASVLRKTPQRNSFKVDRGKIPTHGSEPTRGVGESTDLGASVKREEPDNEYERVKVEVDERTKQLNELRRRVAQSEARNRKARAQQTAREDEATLSHVKTEVPGGLESDLTVEDDDSAVSKVELDELEDGFTAEPTDTVQIKIESNEELEEDTGREFHDAEHTNLASGVQSIEHDEDEASESSSADSSSSITSDSSDEIDSDDEPPEEVDSKPPPTSSTANSIPVCKYFAASGRCRDGEACRFRHETRTEQAGYHLQQQKASQERPQKRDGILDSVRKASARHRKGIFERLKEQEQEEEDKLALKVVKYLGSVGFFKEDVPVKHEP